MRRLLILASTIVFFDVAFYAAIAPLLPDYVADYGLSRAQAGILVSAYAVGTLLASLPAGFVATRLGPRRTVIGGLALLGVSSLVFGFGREIALLDGARFAQGVAGALIWAGALTWLITTAPPERRGGVIGTALGTAVAGALVGPLIGAAAAEVGTRAVFGAVLIAAAGLAAIAARLPEVGPPERQTLREVAATMGSRPVMAAATFVAIPSLMFGAAEVVVPLRIDELGGGHVAIATGFLAGAALEGILAPVIGRVSDRVGRRAPFVAGTAICAFSMVGIAAAQDLAPMLAALMLGSLGAGTCMGPALTTLSAAADTSGLHQGMAVGLANMAWAAGLSLGALGGGAAAGVAGYAAPSVFVAMLLLVTSAYAYRSLLPPPVRPAEG